MCFLVVVFFWLTIVLSTLVGTEYNGKNVFYGKQF
jgi:hypothetical protein